MKINKHNGLIKWKPRRNQVGKNKVVVKASDGNLTAKQSFCVFVKKKPKESRGGGRGGGRSARKSIKGDKSIINKILVKGFNISNASIIVKKIGKRPKEVKVLPRKVYRYLKMENEFYEDYENVIINFKVNKKWLEENGLNEKDIVLSRYKDEKWKDLPTIVKEMEDSYVKYEAETPGFSYFAITIRDKATSKISDILKPVISKIKTPYKISGIIYESLIRKQVDYGTELTIKDIDSGDMVNVKTGIGGNSGAYHTLIHGKKGDVVEISAKGSDKPLTTELTGDINGLNLILDERKGLTKLTGNSIFGNKASYLKKESWPLALISFVFALIIAL